jgi:peptidoglycan/LPS O-acetylase OafA/YrhL
MPTSEPLHLPAAAVPALSSTRLQFIDNLRWVMIVFVVSMHAAVTYSHLGSWYFMEDPKPELGLIVVFATYQTFLQAFFMGLLFFIAGYFVPAAFDRKGFSKFLLDRARRLGLPSLFFMLVIQPVTVYWLLREFAEPSRPSLREAYWPYIASGRFLSGSGPMWFAVALLFFCLIYAVIHLLANTFSKEEHEAALPTNVQVIGLATIIGLATFLVRIVQPMGTNIMNMQLCYFSQYVALFYVGTVAARRNWLLRIPASFARRWFTLTLTLGTVLWFVFVFLLVQTHSEARLSGGFTWQSAAMSVWESFFCVGVGIGLIGLFREKWNWQDPIARWLSDNAFSVYLFHTPILIAVTLAMRSVDAPKPVKFLCATALGTAFSYVASGFIFRKIPVLKRIL